MTPRMQIADAFRQEESLGQVPAGLRDQVVGAVMDRSARAPGTPRLVVLVAVVLAATVIATLVGLRSLRGQSTPAAPPQTPAPVTVSPTATPSAVPSPPAVRFTTARVDGAPGGPHGKAVVVLVETGLRPGESISYRVTGAVDLLYDCGLGRPGGPSYPVREPVDFTATQTADAQGTVSATIAIPPPAGAPACAAVVTGDWRGFVVEDTTSGVREQAGGLNVAT